jgi:branched-chain amino acid transport system substrate-binding protein
VISILRATLENHVPCVTPITGARSLRKPSCHVFHVHTSYSDETQRLVSKLVNLGIKGTAEIALATNGKNLQTVIGQTLADKRGAVFLATAGVASTNLVVGLGSMFVDLGVMGAGGRFIG